MIEMREKKTSQLQNTIQYPRFSNSLLNTFTNRHFWCWNVPVFVTPRCKMILTVRSMDPIHLYMQRGMLGYGVDCYMGHNTWCGNAVWCKAMTRSDQVAPSSRHRYSHITQRRHTHTPLNWQWCWLWSPISANTFERRRSTHAWSAN